MQETIRNVIEKLKSLLPPPEESSEELENNLIEEGILYEKRRAKEFSLTPNFGDLFFSSPDEIRVHAILMRKGFYFREHRHCFYNKVAGWEVPQNSGYKRKGIETFFDGKYKILNNGEDVHIEIFANTKFFNGNKKFITSGLIFYRKDTKEKEVIGYIDFGADYEVEKDSEFAIRCPKLGV